MTRRKPILFDDYPRAGMPFRPARWDWRWEIRDGSTGPLIATGRAVTRAGALFGRWRALGRCKKRFHVVDIATPPLHLLSHAEAVALTAALHRDGIPVTVCVGICVELCPDPGCTVSTRQEVAALVAVKAETDMIVHWAGAR